MVAHESSDPGQNSTNNLLPEENLNLINASGPDMASLFRALPNSKGGGITILFSGEANSIAFGKWFSRAKLDLKMFGINDEERGVLFLGRHFTDTAETIWQGYLAQAEVEGQEIFKTYKEFENHFKPLFTNQVGTSMLLDKLLFLKQTGSINEYLREERQLVGDYVFENDEYRLVLLRNGMKPAYLAKYWDKKPTSYAKAVEVLLDKAFSDNIQAMVSQKSSNNYNSQTYPQPMDVDSLSTWSSNNKGKITVKRVSKDLVQVTLPGQFTPVPIITSSEAGKSYLAKCKICPYCIKVGHVEENCFKKQSDLKQGNATNHT